jgi:hypothetical protein
MWNFVSVRQETMDSRLRLTAPDQGLVSAEFEVEGLAEQILQVSHYPASMTELGHLKAV